MRTTTDRFWARVERSDPLECWPWIGVRNRAGYGVFYLYSGSRRRSVLAHRFAVSLREDLVTGLVVMHSCDNPPCVNPAHLRQATAAENSRDALIKGRLNLAGLTIGQTGSWGAGPQSIAHGTEGGAKTHERRGEQPCPACRAACIKARRRRAAMRLGHIQQCTAIAIRTGRRCTRKTRGLDLCSYHVSTLGSIGGAA